MKKVILIGDSIRMGYQPFVAKKLEGTAEVWGPEVNCRHSLWVLDHLQEWVLDRTPDVVHFNCGIHDVVTMEDGQFQILREQYRVCMERIVRRLADLKGATPIWGTLTPWYVGSTDTPMSKWTRKPEVDEYNAIALEAVRAAGFAVNDLNKVVEDNDPTKVLSEDGLHMSEFGNDVLSDAVVKAVKAAM